MQNHRNGIFTCQPLQLGLARRVAVGRRLKAMEIYHFGSNICKARGLHNLTPGATVGSVYVASARNKMCLWNAVAARLLSGTVVSANI
jgi:hypothetical protein